MEWDSSICPFIHPIFSISPKNLAENWEQRGAQERALRPPSQSIEQSWGVCSDSVKTRPWVQPPTGFFRRLPGREGPLPRPTRLPRIQGPRPAPPGLGSSQARVHRSSIFLNTGGPKATSLDTRLPSPTPTSMLPVLNPRPGPHGSVASAETPIPSGGSQLARNLSHR